MNYTEFKQMKKQAGLGTFIAAPIAGALFGGAAGRITGNDPSDSARQGAGAATFGYIGKGLGSWATKRKAIKSLTNPIESRIGDTLANIGTSFKAGLKPETWLGRTFSNFNPAKFKGKGYISAPLVLLTALGGMAYGANAFAKKD